MMRVFTQTKAGVPADFFAVEARGRDFLDVAEGPPLPAVVSVDARHVAFEWVEAGRPTVTAARDFGRALARMHRESPGRYGAAAPGFIGSLPLDNGAEAT